MWIRLFLLSWLILPAANSATYVAASAGSSDVQAAIDLSSNGDTVQVPAGTSIWLTSVWMTAKSINLIGAGAASTVVVDDVPKSYSFPGVIKATLVTNSFARISGFTFQGGTTNTSPVNFSGALAISGTCLGFRLDHCAFENLNATHVAIAGEIYGVADHCTTVCNYKQSFLIFHDTINGTSYGDGSWNTSATLGSSNAFFIEDCAFTESNANTPGAIDTYAGGRVVIRHNAFTNCTATTHGTESGGRYRSVRSFENYNNTFKTDGSHSTTTGQFRGGTGTWYSNTYIGPYASGMTLTCYRLWESFSPWGQANGTNDWDTNSATIYDSGTHTGGNGATTLTDATKTWTVNEWVGYTIWNVTENKCSLITANTATSITFIRDTSFSDPYWTFDLLDSYQIRFVYLSLDQPGRGLGGILTGNPATPIDWPDQALEPIYAWSNMIDGVEFTLSAGNYGSQVVTNREYYNHTLMPGYAPYTYPHSLNVRSVNPSHTGFPRGTRRGIR